MSIETDVDRAVFFDTDDFGVEATINGLPVDGIFDDAYEDVLNVGSSDPAFTCRTSDVSSVVEADPVIIGGVTYKVAGQPQPDGTGVTVLPLEEQ